MLVSPLCKKNSKYFKDSTELPLCKNVYCKTRSEMMENYTIKHNVCINKLLFDGK